jgi:hypothetical protein
MFGSVSDSSPAKAPHPAYSARRLRSGAWLLQRSWRHPHRLPAGWRSERFVSAVERTRQQLHPIRTLSALADSFARESLHLAPELAPLAGSHQGRFGGSPLEVAYVTRWIELDAGRELHDWDTLCERALR